ncbi:STAS domain-containing protein [Kitasatospora sp. NPDC085895]|uniref:STAS domain-containing protein n=1 Tax=Kitasatospora sp. NPDC085895 TaxID=3155057 RepID=UPI00344E900E
MTDQTVPPFVLTAARTAAGTLTLVLCGDLDYDSSDDFLKSAAGHLEALPGLRHLHLDCTRVTGFDSTALSALLMLHRRTAAVGTQLHLDHRPPGMQRVLEITGTLGHLTGRPAGTPENTRDRTSS